jgi:hypothetical protein
MSTQSIESKQQALKFVEQSGECVLFPLKGYPDLFSQVAGPTIEDRRTKAWYWSDELHLEKKIFLSLAIKGRVTLTSWGRFVEVFPKRSSKSVTTAEEEILDLIRQLGPTATPDMRRAASLPKNLFDQALKRLRQNMRVAIIEIKQETKTKHVYSYDLTERWVPDMYIAGDAILGGNVSS